MWCKKILVAYDGSAPSHRALEVMREIAAQNPAVEVVLVHVMRLFSSGSAAAGMDTVMVDDAMAIRQELEAIAAAHCGYEILGVTLCANMAAGVLPQPLSGEEVNEMAEQSAPHFSSLILGCLERL